ncbi:Ger(x)C family spore germination protein [Fictibacillus nanhaiensis]|uniref:Ger(x)C family spore germination protein n=1 Tax=Fictibacillus nanhaiensis TaxID=742169 RepID=UPI001C96919B|nr:Ger(x)C family spore germination protein [Fictibacillus nanhaiensis]MBY6035018.1 Ger(x)C family spore germination protein [Fictibacillus nanhaiensis]
MKKSLVLLLAVVLSSCAPKEVLDDITIVKSIGFDLHPKKDHITGTILFPIFINEETFKINHLTATGETAREVALELNEMTAKPIFAGKVNTIMFSQKLAEKGILETIDTLQRDPGIGRAIFLAVTKEDAKKIMTHNFELTNTDGNYFSHMIEQNEHFSNLPRLNFHTFLYAYYHNNMDAVLPYLTLKKNAVKIKGLALFKGDKMVGTVHEQQLLTFKTLIEPTKEGSYQFATRSYRGNLEVLKSKIHYKLFQKPHHHVLLEVNVKGRLNEYTKMDAGDPKVIKSIEKNIEADLEKESMKLIRKFQRLNIDPLGIGENVRARTRAFNQKEWKRDYKDLKISVDYSVEITEAGIAQ